MVMDYSFLLAPGGAENWKNGLPFVSLPHVKLIINPQHLQNFAPLGLPRWIIYLAPRIHSSPRMYAASRNVLARMAKNFVENGGALRSK
ncbi:hypothetical protein M758_9G130200 [Ceratodon purpureus]|nr:hypothetical protein M758_9G130200 [Ceratodon purpureus]